MSETAKNKETVTAPLKLKTLNDNPYIPQNVFWEGVRWKVNFIKGSRV